MLPIEHPLVIICHMTQGTAISNPGVFRWSNFFGQKIDMKLGQLVTIFIVDNSVVFVKKILWPFCVLHLGGFLVSSRVAATSALVRESSRLRATTTTITSTTRGCGANNVRCCTSFFGNIVRIYAASGHSMDATWLDFEISCHYHVHFLHESEHCREQAFHPTQTTSWS